MNAFGSGPNCIRRASGACYGWQSSENRTLPHELVTFGGRGGGGHGGGFRGGRGGWGGGLLVDGYAPYALVDSSMLSDGDLGQTAIALAPSLGPVVGLRRYGLRG